MKTRLVRMGNSRGVRLPKPLIEQAGLSDEVELELRGNTIVIVARPAPRRGWAEAARRLRAEGGDQLLDPPTPTRFDETEWQW
ncbi:MAG: AbrB/MazE/SpoVT family DNA-binding domain-containing protein [Deltaproteobacteria bacterium]|nr:AbrB/MazE/SpoVT family DNA-binding domain-containing protein [Deltaproteobacteria bacterium]